MAPLILLAIGLAAIFLFRWADRKVGSDDPRPKSTGYGAVFLFGLLCHGLNYVAALPSLWLVAIMAHVWILYRSLPWKVGGSMTPRTGPELAASFARHALPGLVCAAVLTGSDPGFWATGQWGFLAVFFAFACLATVQHQRYGRLVWSSRPVNLAVENAHIESTRGAAYGVCLAMVALFA